MSEKKQWALNAAKNFYEEVEKKFKNVKTTEEAIEIFKRMFPNEREFYKHLRKHIILKYEELEDRCKTWQDTKIIDDKFQGKFSKDYFKVFVSTLSYLKEVLYQSISSVGKRRVLIYSKKRNIAVIMEGNYILSIHKNDFDSIDEWIDNMKKGSKLIDEIIKAGVDSELKEKSKTIQGLLRRFD